MAGPKDGMMGMEVWSSEESLPDFLASKPPAIFERAGACRPVRPQASARQKSSSWF